MLERQLSEMQWALRAIESEGSSPQNTEAPFRYAGDLKRWISDLEILLRERELQNA